MRLSKRLFQVAKYIEGFHSLVDVACDHGYLGIYCALNYDMDKVLLTDINQEPLRMAIQNISNFGLEGQVFAQLGDGLKPVDSAYDVISICGVGGKLIADILHSDLKVAKSAKRLVLCANNDNYTLRSFLANNGFEIVQEEMVLDYKYYEIIVAEPTSSKPLYTELELKYGPLLLKKKSQSFYDFYQKKLKTLEKQSVNAKKSGKEELVDKIKELKKILD